ncbi:MAG TPA: sulfotransferase [Terriglobales bacterium]|jgi:hypothetical protein|nr:sulfotransferase [Terriglobales bacterium]
MTSSGNYYQTPSTARDPADQGRFPRNHVRYPARFKPVEWLNALHVRMGVSPLSIEKAVRAAYDSAAPYDAHLGTTEELGRLRAMVVTLARGLDDNPYLLGVGRVLVKKLLTDRLNARNAVLRHFAANKSFIEARGRVRAPLIITGLPRTGSTLLQRLLAEDPNARSPFTFEMESPLPPLTEGQDPLADSRIAEANDVLQVLSRTAPGFLEKFGESHLWSPTECEESYIYMLAHNGLLVLDAPNAGETYTRALAEFTCHGPVLRYERLFFTLLDSYRPASSHWILKAPNYAPAFPHVVQEYPDARIVLTHRNPLICLPSVCRLFESWCIAFTRDGCFDKYRFAKLVSALLVPCFSVPFQYRRADPSRTRRVFDCMYDDLFSDPIAMVKRIYDWFDLEVSSTFEQRMRSYLDNNRQGKYGRHRYSLEEYAIDPREFLEEHSEYMNHYGFTSEGARARKRALCL